MRICHPDCQYRRGCPELRTSTPLYIKHMFSTKSLIFVPALTRHGIYSVSSSFTRSFWSGFLRQKLEMPITNRSRATLSSSPLSKVWTFDYLQDTLSWTINPISSSFLQYWSADQSPCLHCGQYCNQVSHLSHGSVEVRKYETHGALDLVPEHTSCIRLTRSLADFSTFSASTPPTVSQHVREKQALEFLPELQLPAVETKGLFGHPGQWRSGQLTH